MSIFNSTAEDRPPTAWESIVSSASNYGSQLVTRALDKAAGKAGLTVADTKTGEAAAAAAAPVPFYKKPWFVPVVIAAGVVVVAAVFFFKRK